MPRPGKNFCTDRRGDPNNPNNFDFSGGTKNTAIEAEKQKKKIADRKKLAEQIAEPGKGTGSQESSGSYQFQVNRASESSSGNKGSSRKGSDTGSAVSPRRSARLAKNEDKKY